MGSEPGIVVTSVARSFGDVHAVRDASFTAEPGRVTGLVGPNGSGKTTLLLMLASLLAPDTGTISVAGHDPLGDPIGVRTAMGWMPDTLGSWPTLTVRESLALTGRLYGMRSPAARARAAQLIELADLGELADRPTKVLSRGQKQRLSLARSLVHDPQVLLLDEPASGLDPGARIALRELLRRLATEGRTILVSSHILAELEEMTDAAVFIEAGVTVSAERIAQTKVGAREWRYTTVDGTATSVLVDGGAEGAADALARLVADGTPGRELRARGRRARAHVPRPPGRGREVTAAGAWWAKLWAVASLELRQRVRGVAWYVLLGVFALLILIVTVVTSIAYSSIESVNADGSDSGASDGGVFSIIVYFVLLLSTLVTPALSGNAINGDREDGTLATTQVTLVSSAQIALGKFLAAWITTLAFAVAALPFLIYAVARYGGSALTIVVSLAVLIVEMGVIAAFGVGLSGLIRRPILSVVVTYLLVAGLSVGTLIGFGLGGAAIQDHTKVTSTYADWDAISAAQAAGKDPFQPGLTQIPKPEYCTHVESYDAANPRWDLVWGWLAANPYVVLADAVPTNLDANGNPTDAFGLLKVGVRLLQHYTPPASYDECDPANAQGQSTPKPADVLATTTPTWFVGLAIHLIAAIALLLWAILVGRTPTRRLAAGSRIA